MNFKWPITVFSLYTICSFDGIWSGFIVSVLICCVPTLTVYCAFFIWTPTYSNIEKPNCFELFCNISFGIFVWLILKIPLFHVVEFMMIMFDRAEWNRMRWFLKWNFFNFRSLKFFAEHRIIFNHILIYYENIYCCCYLNFICNKHLIFPHNFSMLKISIGASPDRVNLISFKAPNFIDVHHYWHEAKSITEFKFQFEM